MTRLHPNRNSESPIVIAIDGPAGAGKSTIAARLARHLGIPYLDTGAMYRTVALIALRAGLSLPLDEGAARQVLQLVGQHDIQVAVDQGGTTIIVDGETVDADLRTPECSSMASAVSALSEVRRELVAMQRRLGRSSGGVVEGRDIGTVVFPDARLKVFLTAEAEERARRRYLELRASNAAVRLAQVHEEQLDRDRQDSSRIDSPLEIAPGAVVVDTTTMTPDEVVHKLVEELERSRLETLDSSDRNTVRSRNDAS